MFTLLLMFRSTKITPAGDSSVCPTTAFNPFGAVSISSWCFMYSNRSRRNSFSPKSIMEMPLVISSTSTTSSCRRFNCDLRYSRSPFSSALIRSSSPVEVITEIFMRVSTRLFKLIYSSKSISGQKFTSWIYSFLLPIRSIRPNR